MVRSIEEITDFISMEEGELENVQKELARAIVEEAKYEVAGAAAEEKYNLHTKALENLQATLWQAQLDYVKMKDDFAETERKLANHQEAHAETYKSIKELKEEQKKQLEMYGTAAAALEAQIDTKKKSLKDLQFTMKNTRGSFNVLAESYKGMMDELRTASDVEIALDMEIVNNTKFQSALTLLQGDLVDAYGHHETWAVNLKMIQQELLDVKNGVATQAKIDDLKRKNLAEMNAIQNSDIISVAEKIVLIAKEKQDLVSAKVVLKEEHYLADSKIMEHKESFAELKRKYESMRIKYQSILTQNSLFSHQIGEAQGCIESVKEFCEGNMATIVKSLNFA